MTKGRPLGRPTAQDHGDGLHASPRKVCRQEKQLRTRGEGGHGGVVDSEMERTSTVTVGNISAGVFCRR